MICFRDRTYCINEKCQCHRKLTQEVIDAAERWWNPDDIPEKRGQAPVAVADICEGKKIDD